MHTLTLLFVIFAIGIIPAAIGSYIIYALTHWTSSCSDTGEKFVFTLAAIFWPLTIALITAFIIFGTIYSAFRSHQADRKNGQGYL